MKTPFHTVRDEYNVTNPEAVIKITAKKLSDMLEKYASESCDIQKSDCCKKIAHNPELMLMVLGTPLPKHLRVI